MKNTLLRVLARIAESNVVVSYYGSRRNREEPLKYYEEMFDTKEDRKSRRREQQERREEKAAKRKIAPENLQKGLLEKVIKNRSPIEREKAIELLPDNLVEEQIRNKKQMKRVRLKGLRLLSDNAALVDELAKGSDLPELQKRAMELTKNQDILLDHFKQSGDSKSFWALDEDTVMKNLPKDTSKLNTNSWGSNFSEFIEKIEKPETANKLLKALLKDDPDFDKLELFEKADDPKLLKAIFPKLDGYDTDKLQAYIILNLKDDEAFLRKALLNKNTQVPNLILNILDDQKDYKDFVSKAPPKSDLNYALKHIDDEKFIKDALVKQGKDPYIDQEVFEKIQDQDFLKDYYKKTKDTKALTNVTDDAFLKKAFTKDGNVLREIKDEEFLKDYYTKNIPPKGSAKPERESAARKRAPTLKNIKDQEFLQKVAKKDPHYEIRMEALKYITDSEALEKILLRESSKTALMKMIENVNDQDVLMKIILKRSGDTDGDIRRKTYERLNPDSTLKLLHEGNKPPKHKVKEIDDKILKKLFLDNATLAEVYYSIFRDDEPYLLKLLKAHEGKSGYAIGPTLVNDIKNEKVLKEMLKDPETLKAYSPWRGDITDPEIIEYILLNKKDLGDDALDLLTALDPSDEFIQKLMSEAASPTVRKEAAAFIKDNDFLLDKMLAQPGGYGGTPTSGTSAEEAYNIFRQIWNDIKDDPKKVERIAKESRHSQVIKGILPKIKGNDDLLYEAAKNNEDIRVRLMSLMKDRKPIIKLIPTLTGWNAWGDIKDKSLIQESLMTVKDIDFYKAKDLFNHLQKSDQRVPYLELYLKAASDFVKVAALLRVPKEQEIPDKLIDDDLLLRVAENKKIRLDNKVKIIEKMKDKEKIMKIIPTLDRNNLRDISDRELIYDALMKDPNVTYQQAGTLFEFLHEEDEDAEDAEEAYIFVLRDSDIKNLYEKAASPEVKGYAVLKLSADELPEYNLIEESLIDSFMVGMGKTDRPYEVDKKLIKKIYDAGTDEQQDALQGFLEMKDLLPRHKEAIDKPFSSPQKKGKVFKRLEDQVEKNPIHQVFRLLVHLAR